jgi:hypothetical protein
VPVRKPAIDDDATTMCALYEGQPACSAAPRRYGTLPLMRFLHYPSPGGSLPAHVDLPRVLIPEGGVNTHPDQPRQVEGGVNTQGVRTTHSFLLYLTDCEYGGETLLLEAKPGDAKLAAAGGVAPGERHVLARSAPRRGKLLIMPHACPHSAAPVVSAPKLLIRGEMLLPTAPPLREDVPKSKGARKMYPALDIHR